MKTIFSLLSLILLLSINTFSQGKKYDTYVSSYANKTFDITVYPKEEGDFNIFINTSSFDDLTGGVFIKKKKLEEFIQNLVEAKLKYKEWVATAKTNKVEELNKVMELNTSIPKFEGHYYYGSDWFHNYNAKFEYALFINKDGDKVNYYLVLRTGSLEASTNQFIKCKGLYIVFANEEEIDDFCNKLSLDKISTFLSKPNQENLFK